MSTAGAHVRGAVLVALGAASYGATIVFGRDLATAGLGAATVLSARFTIAGAVLLVVDRLTRAGGVAAGERRPLVALGLVYTVESTLFFMALERGTAAAVALLFYCFPAVVTVIELATGTSALSPRLFAALAASTGGAVIVVAAGADVAITGAGVAFAFTSALTFALYLLAGDRTVPRTGAVAKAGWVAFACGLGHIARGVVTGSMRSPAGHLPALLGNAAVTTTAFAFMFAGLQRIGPSRTAVVMTLEAFFAIVFAAVFLGEELGAVQVAGGAAILTGAVLVASAPRGAPAVADDLEGAPAEPP